MDALSLLCIFFSRVHLMLCRYELICALLEYSQAAGEERTRLLALLARHQQPGDSGGGRGGDFTSLRALRRRLQALQPQRRRPTVFGVLSSS